jgi:hypothetical protein
MSEICADFESGRTLDDGDGDGDGDDRTGRPSDCSTNGGSGFAS